MKKLKTKIYRQRLGIKFYLISILIKERRRRRKHLALTAVPFPRDIEFEGFPYFCQRLQLKSSSMQFGCSILLYSYYMTSFKILPFSFCRALFFPYLDPVFIINIYKSIFLASMPFVFFFFSFSFCFVCLRVTFSSFLFSLI